MQQDLEHEFAAEIPEDEQERSRETPVDSHPTAAIGSTTAPTRGNVASNPDAHATSAHNPATSESAFANERSRPSGRKIECAMAAACRTTASGTSHSATRAGAGSALRGHRIQ